MKKIVRWVISASDSDVPMNVFLVTVLGIALTCAEIGTYQSIGIWWAIFMIPLIIAGFIAFFAFFAGLVFVGDKVREWAESEDK